MTFNQFKLLCIVYLKPFEGKPFNELVHSSDKSRLYNFNLNYIVFNKIYDDYYDCDDMISKQHIIINYKIGLHLWDDEKCIFVTIDNNELVDVI